MAMQAASSVLSYLYPFGWTWGTQTATPKASMSAFATSFNNGVAQFKTGMSSFNSDDQQLNGNNITVSYVFKSATEDLTASFSFSNQKELPARLKLSVPLALTFNFQGAKEEVHERIYNFVTNYNKSQKETHTYIKIQDSIGYRNLTIVDILLKGYVGLENPNLEQELTAFKASAQKVKENLDKVIKGRVVPDDETEGFEFVAKTTGPRLKGKQTVAYVLSSLTFPIKLNADLLNAKRTKFESIVGGSSPSPFASAYAFKMQEKSVVNAKFTTEDKTKYVFYNSIQMTIPSRGSQNVYEGYRQQAEKKKPKPEGQLLLKQDLKNGELKYVGCMAVDVSKDPSELNKNLDTFWCDTQNYIRAY